ncbi:hypothetical protein [Flavobacterium polysaccharolyticum]|uniref:Uncharacterized protein n=1 Tax=Flavobacterium polysaccharolyticum TaxID=3133148 RepID=A0ABU9NTR7_9FLAO
METITTTKADDILKALNEINKKIDQFEANNIKNISKLIDDKFQKNFLKAGSVETQKLSDELDFELKNIQLQNEIEKFRENKIDVQKLLLNKNIKNLSKIDQEILTKLDKISGDGRLLDRFLKSQEKDKNISFYNLVLNSLLSSSIFNIERKLIELAKIPEPVIP